MSEVDDYIFFNIPCPISGCKNNDSRFWEHTYCKKKYLDNRMKINSKGYLKCNACGHIIDLLNMEFNCESGHEKGKIKISIHW